MCIPCFTFSWCDFFSLFSKIFIFLTNLQWALFIHFIPFYFSSVNSPPVIPHLDLLFSLSPPYSPLFLSMLSFLITLISPLHHLILFIPHSLFHPFPSPLFFFSLSVFCVSRTLMVTQIFWLLAVLWGWDAVSALHLEVLYNLHSASYSQNCCPKHLPYWINMGL